MAPSRYGRYILRQKLGQGGMGHVYIAHDPKIGRDVALKLLPATLLQQADLLRRFRQEAQLVARLEHAAIVPVYDFGQEHGQPYIVMRLMTGGSLTDRIARGPLAPTAAAQILARICAALDKAHSRQIIHRDIKPDNILFDEDGAAFLADFGIARLTAGAQTMTIIGTPRYMAPEQAHGRALDARTDVYQIGLVLYEMLSGTRPFTADTPASLLYQHAHEPPPPLRTQNSALPPAVEQVVMRALAKEPNQRFPSAGALYTAYRHALRAGATEVLTPAPAPPKQRGFRFGLLGAFAGLLLIAGLLFGAYFAGFIPLPTFTSAGNTPPATATPAATEIIAINPPDPTNLPTTQPTNLPTIQPTNTPTITPTPVNTPTPAPPTPTPDPNFPPPAPALGDFWIRPADSAMMLFVPQGAFLMGSDPAVEPNAAADAQPQRLITMDGFWIDEVEVTNDQFNRFLNATGHVTTAEQVGSSVTAVGDSWQLTAGALWQAPLPTR